MSDRGILIIEDNADDILLLGRAFREAQLEGALSVVRDGDEAIRHLEAAAGRERGVAGVFPSLILLDLKLPRRTGLEVLSWIRNHPDFRKTPVVVLTSSTMEADLDKAYALGANSYLLKPVSYSQLLDMVKALKLWWMEYNRGPGTKLK
ncbi:MAG TPA: response regulator [Planctomycetota bacterium]|nr:response regulator [Planctomycetota bacterium]